MITVINIDARMRKDEHVRPQLCGSASTVNEAV
jgi:hypothetical protein